MKVFVGLFVGMISELCGCVRWGLKLWLVVFMIGVICSGFLRVCSAFISVCLLIVECFMVRCFLFWLWRR